LTAETKEHRDGLTGLSIDEIRLNRTLLLPCGNGLADERVDRFRVGRSGFIRRYIEQTCRIFANHVRRCGRGTRRASLPPDASDAQPHQLVAAESSKQPGECQGSNKREWIHRPRVFRSFEPPDLGHILLLEVHASPEQLGPQLVGEDAWVWADQPPDGARRGERTLRIEASRAPAPLADHERIPAAIE
jgi:hypothetical protein